MTHDEHTRNEARHQRACDIITGASAILLIVCVSLIVYWFAWAVTQ